MIRYLRTIDLKGRKYMSLQPFVKWAGGKRQIMDKLLEFMPKKYKHYYEPFVGGGALLLELAPIHATINDSNKELIYVYKCLRSKRLFKKMYDICKIHEANHSEEYYYQVRDSYLYLVGNFKLDDSKFDNFQKNHIILKQYLPHTEVLKLYSKMDCQIILRKRKRSNNAGFPTKVMESIALQTAVLCNDFSDLRFVAKTNPVSFIEEGGLEQLINKNNYQFDISLFSSDYYLDSFAQFVEKIYEN